MYVKPEANEASSQAMSPSQKDLRATRYADANSAVIQPAVAIVDKWGIVNFSSPAMESLFKANQEQLEGCDVTSLLPGLPLNRKTPEYNLAFAEAWEHEATWRKLKGYSPNGENLLLEVLLKKLRIKNDEFILLGIRATCQNAGLTDELSRVIESAKEKTDAVMIISADGVIYFVNRAFENSTGYTLAETVGKPASFIKPDLLNPDFYRRMWSTLLAGNEFRSLFANRKKSGEIFYEDTHVRPFIDGFGVSTHIVLTSRDIGEPWQSTLLRLQREAFHDDLTDLPNRNLFRDRLKQSLSRASREHEKLTLLFVDLDDFKAMNDTYGHAFGDAVLRTTASCLDASIREEDTVARIGGDEFAILLLNTRQRKDVEIVANKILVSLADGLFFEGVHFPIHASIGACLYPDDTNNLDTLIKQADFAMYAAKSNGGHCLHFFNTEDEQTMGARISGLSN